MKHWIKMSSTRRKVIWSDKFPTTNYAFMLNYHNLNPWLLLQFCSKCSLNVMSWTVVWFCVNLFPGALCLPMAPPEVTAPCPTRSRRKTERCTTSATSVWRLLGSCRISKSTWGRTLGSGRSNVTCAPRVSPSWRISRSTILSTQVSFWRNVVFEDIDRLISSWDVEDG